MRRGGSVERRRDEMRRGGSVERRRDEKKKRRISREEKR